MSATSCVSANTLETTTPTSRRRWVYECCVCRRSESSQSAKSFACTSRVIEVLLKILNGTKLDAICELVLRFGIGCLVLSERLCSSMLLWTSRRWYGDAT
ncbi:hypothetical protein HZ326_11105 [Fusarium oxysporum f. sp. albedinis]|nr:hypothetical protein HZ326_11105 [Fusarium oxysporum f. sp. albedinis]